MLNLEKAIVEWRRQMATGGFEDPEVLDELESHLCDEVERQMNSGLDPRRAFVIATQRIGPAIELNGEFEIARSTLGNPNEPMKQTLINILTILAVLGMGLGLVLPAVAKLREVGTLAKFDIAMLLIGTALLASSAMFGAYSIFRRRKA